MRFDGDNGDEPYQQADDLFEAMKKINWLKTMTFMREVLVFWGRNAFNNIGWETEDGFIYHFTFKGPTKEAVKIVFNLKKVE